MTYNSILFNTPPGTVKEIQTQPLFFTDLNLDQIVDAVTISKQDYDLKPIFYTPLTDTDTIQYRHEIAHDLENEKLLRFIRTFAEGMSSLRQNLALIEKLHYTYHKKGWILKTIDLYCHTVSTFSHDLSDIPLHSRGLTLFRDYLSSYAASDFFIRLKQETEHLKKALDQVHYCLFIKDNHIRVTRYNGETDYSKEIEDTFRKFKQGSVKDYSADLTFRQSMNHIEAAILDMVAALYPKTFTELDSYTAQYTDFQDAGIRIFDREIQFYLAYLEYTARFTCEGLSFCYPEVTNTTKELYSYQSFDLALAQNLIATNKKIVCNDFFLEDPQRIIVVSGPNQGGKTTFARVFGQLHYLAALGCCVPGQKACLFHYDILFTQFEREEDITTLRSKLEDDIMRIHDILEDATGNSVIIMNEIFSSTTLHDAVLIGTRILKQIAALDALCVWVTFVDEFSTFNEKTISMVSTVVPENPAERTYRIVREKADGLAYALSIAEKYNLTYKQLLNRIVV